MILIPLRPLNIGYLIPDDVAPYDEGPPALTLFGSAGNFNQMEPELGLHRTVHHANGIAEDNLIEFFDHLALGKRAQVTPLLA